MKATRRSFLAALASLPFLGKLSPAEPMLDQIIQENIDRTTRNLARYLDSKLYGHAPDVLWVNASTRARIDEFFGGLHEIQRDPDRYTWMEK